VVHLAGVAADAPMAREEWNNNRMLRNFSMIRKLEGRPWPPGGWRGGRGWPEPGRQSWQVPEGLPGGS
jgi:hypothetical protein